MALDLRLYKAFDNLFDLIFKDLKVTINDYPKIFEENFERTKSGLKLTPFFSSCSEEEFSELKYDLFNKYCNKFIYQSSEVIAIEAPEHVEWLKNKSSEINWNQWNVYSD